MLRIDVQQARPGMTLALPVMHPEFADQTLLRVGYELTEPTLRRLKQLQVETVWVSYPALNLVSRFVNADRVERDARMLKVVDDAFAEAQQGSAVKLKYDEYNRAVDGLVSALVENPDAALYMSDLLSVGEGLTRHSTSVMYLSLMMGLRLGGYLVRERKHVASDRAQEVVSLGVGAMLHDVGVTQLAEAVRLAYDQTGDDSDPLWREHPALGFRMVRGQVEPTAAAVVLHHHQRADGKGYAGADFPVLAGGSIHPFARIAAVADAFDRLHRPTNLPEQPPVWVLGAMLSEPIRSRYDPDVLRALLDVVPPYAPGSMLRLTDGTWAVALDHHPSNPCRPTVQPIPDPETLAEDAGRGGGETSDPAEPINLSQAASHLAVAECDGVPVAGLNFGPNKIPGSLVSAVEGG